MLGGPIAREGERREQRQEGQGSTACTRKGTSRGGLTWRFMLLYVERTHTLYEAEATEASECATESKHGCASLEWLIGGELTLSPHLSLSCRYSFSTSLHHIEAAISLCLGYFSRRLVCVRTDMTRYWFHSLLCFWVFASIVTADFGAKDWQGRTFGIETFVTEPMCLEPSAHEHAVLVTVRSTLSKFGVYSSPP